MNKSLLRSPIFLKKRATLLQAKVFFSILSFSFLSVTSLSSIWLKMFSFNVSPCKVLHSVVSLFPLRASRESPAIQEKKKSTIWQLWEHIRWSNIKNIWMLNKSWKDKTCLSLALFVPKLCPSLQLVVQSSTRQTAVLQRQHPLQVSLTCRFHSATQPHHVPDFYLQPHAGVLPWRVSGN